MAVHPFPRFAGIGKTTLAHVIARHCGYRVVEVNASDERSRPALLSAICNAVQMQPVLGEKRPNCVVIDEIDGAIGGEGVRAASSAVSAVAEILRKGELPAEGTRGEGKKGTGELLQRPLICICNDLYTPALRVLREEAEVVVMSPPEAHALAARLREVCNQEHVDASEQVRGAAMVRDIEMCLRSRLFVLGTARDCKCQCVSQLGFVIVMHKSYMCHHNCMVGMDTSRHWSCHQAHALCGILCVMATTGGADMNVLMCPSR
jgi:SpoVK/Ycf46/Vps4 family AAA+-type ATPase